MNCLLDLSGLPTSTTITSENAGNFPLHSFLAGTLVTYSWYQPPNKLRQLNISKVVKRGDVRIHSKGRGQNSLFVTTNKPQRMTNVGD